MHVQAKQLDTATSRLADCALARTAVTSPAISSGDVTCNLGLGTAYEFYLQHFANTTTIAGTVTFTGTATFEFCLNVSFIS